MLKSACVGQIHRFSDIHLTLFEINYFERDSLKSETKKGSLGVTFLTAVPSPVFLIVLRSRVGFSSSFLWMFDFTDFKGWAEIALSIFSLTSQSTRLSILKGVHDAELTLRNSNTHTKATVRFAFHHLPQQTSSYCARRLFSSDNSLRVTTSRSSDES